MNISHQGIAPRSGRRLSSIGAVLLVALTTALASAWGAAKVPDNDPKPVTVGASKEISRSERIRFDQSKVALEMTELENRMFRLSDSLRKLEPENASRLTLALKFARKELILHQMTEVQQLLQTVKLRSAASEQKQLVQKLRRLEELLLSNDLDFQMQLDRLRLLREVLRQLDTAIKEEERELKQSKEAAERQEELAKLSKRQESLAELVRQQTENVAGGKSLAKANSPPGELGKSLASLSKAQQGTRQGTQSLAKAKSKSGAPSANLNQAEKSMAQALEKLERKEAEEALPEQEKALASLEKELADNEKKLAELRKQVDKDKFAAMQRDQKGNRKLTEGISEKVRDLGDSGASALSELLRASGSMSSAEGALGAQQAGAAGSDQSSALAALNYAKEQLAMEEQKLLESLRKEMKGKVITALMVMLEKQTEVRKETEKIAPQVAAGARAAIASAVGLSKAEGQIITIADEMIGLVEETEFGIALPAALRVVRRSMESVHDSLAKADTSEPTIALERRIEADLKALVEAMKDMPGEPPKGKPRKGKPGPDRSRELNKLIAELKMIRIMQKSVNNGTVHVDGKRGQEKAAKITAQIRKEISGLEDSQEDVLDTTEQLIEARAQDLGLQ